MKLRTNQFYLCSLSTPATDFNGRLDIKQSILPTICPKQFARTAQFLLYSILNLVHTEQDSMDGCLESIDSIHGNEMGLVLTRLLSP